MRDHIWIFFIQWILNYEREIRLLFYVFTFVIYESDSRYYNKGKQNKDRNYRNVQWISHPLRLKWVFDDEIEI